MKCMRSAFLSLLILSPLFVTAEEQEEPSLDSLRDELERRLEAFNKPLQEFEENYTKRLEDLSQTIQDKGDLPGVLIVREEANTFREIKERDFSSIPELAKLREIYEKNVPTISTTVAQNRQKVMQNYLSTVKDRKLRETKQGRIESALEYSEEEKRILAKIREEAESLAGIPGTNPMSGAQSSGSAPLWQLTGPNDYSLRGGIVVEPKGGSGWRLEKGSGVNTRLVTNRSFRAPFRMVARLTPENDSDVRFFYGDQFLALFNYGPEKDGLVLFALGNKKTELNGAGQLHRGRSHLLEIEVLEDSITAFIDGEETGSIKGDFRSFNDSLAISPFRDCPVLLESFSVFPPSL